MSKIKHYETEDAVGIEMTIPIEGRENETATAVLMTACGYNSPTPYVFAVPNANQRLLTNVEYENICEAFLKEVKESDSPLVTEELKQYADKVLEQVKDLERAFAENSELEIELHWGEDEERIQNYDELRIKACLIDESKPAARDNIEFYLVTEGTVLDDEDSIFKLASNIVNIDEVIRCREEEKESLQAFYETYIHDIRNMDYRDMTAQQRENMNTFSDWHKDVYKHRPHDDSRNECLVLHNFQESKAVKPKGDTERE